MKGPGFNPQSSRRYKAVYRFKAPPSGTGTVTFRCLIKKGPANGGYFFYPANDLVLTEATAGKSISAWQRAGSGESCGEFCAKSNTDCDAATGMSLAHKTGS